MASKLALLLVVASIFFGISSFVLCIAAEASRTEVDRSPGNGKCAYSGNGRAPLAYAIAAFFSLAMTMYTEHAYMMVSANSSQNGRSPSSQNGRSPAVPTTIWSAYNALAWQSCLLLLTTWLCFATAEVILMIGIIVESGHLRRWKSPRSSCTVMRPELFGAAGVLGLPNLFVVFAWFLTDLIRRNLHKEGVSGNLHKEGGSETGSEGLRPS